MSIRHSGLVNFDDLRWPPEINMEDIFDIRDILKQKFLRFFPLDK